MAAKSARKGPTKAKKNLLDSLGVESVDYKDTATLRVFISDRGKIRSRGVTGLTVQQQRQVAQAIKNAREMALLPYPGRQAATRCTVPMTRIRQAGELTEAMLAKPMSARRTRQATKRAPRAFFAS